LADPASSWASATDPFAVGTSASRAYRAACSDLPCTPCTIARGGASASGVHSYATIRFPSSATHSKDVFRMRAAAFLHDQRPMGRANCTSSTQRTKKNTCAVIDSSLKAGASSDAVEQTPPCSRLEHADQTMRSQGESSSTTDGQSKPRRGREKPAKRWGQIDRTELNAILEQAAEEENRAFNLRFEALSLVSATLLEGARLSTDTYVVGRISHGVEPLRFACTRKRDGRVIEMFQSYDEGNIDERGPYAIALRERDWSVFAAARAFVESVGPELALAAARDRHRQQKSSSRSRPGELTVSP